MNKKKLVLLFDNEYMGGSVAATPPVVSSDVIFRINNLANRRNGGVTIFSPNDFLHDAKEIDIDDGHINTVLSIRLDDNQYYTQGI